MLHVSLSVKVEYSNSSYFQNELDKMTPFFMIFQINVSSMNYLKCVHYVLTIKSVNLFDNGFNKPVYRCRCTRGFKAAE